MIFDVASSWIEAHPGMASWVQAVGTILAIAVAIYIAQLPEKRHRKEEASRIRVMKMAIVNIANGAAGSITDLRDEVAEINSSQFVFPDALLMAAEAHMTTLSSVDLTKFPNEVMLVPFMSIKAEMESGISNCKMLKGTNINQLDQFSAQSKLDAAANNIHSSILALREAMSATDRQDEVGFRAWKSAISEMEFTMRTRIKINLWMSTAALAIAFFAPLLANYLFEMWKPSTDSSGVWLERSGSITTVFSLLVIGLMDECIGTIRTKSEFNNLKKIAHVLRGFAFAFSIYGTLIWGYGTLVMAYVNGFIGSV
jgi:hypothetical protein